METGEGRLKRHWRLYWRITPEEMQWFRGTGDAAMARTVGLVLALVVGRDGGVAGGGGGDPDQVAGAGRFLIVYHADYQKNACCVGAYCANYGFRADGTTANDESSAAVAVGDINGDGIPDLFISAPFAAANWNGYIHVVFATKKGFPNPLPLNSLNGSNGFRLDAVIAWGHRGFSLALADVNGDGYADIVIGTDNAYVVFGGPTSKGGTAWASGITLNGGLINGTDGFRFDSVSANSRLTTCSGAVASVTTPTLATGDVNGDRLADIIISRCTGNSLAGYTYVVYGTKTGGFWSNPLPLSAIQ